MRNDDIGFHTVFYTLPPFSFTGLIPPFSTRDEGTSPTFSPGTPTNFLTSTPSFDMSLDSNLLPTFTQTGDPTITDIFPSSTGTLDTLPLSSEDPTSLPLTLTDISTPVTLPTEFTSNLFSDPSITIGPSTSFPVSIPTSVSDSLMLTSTFSDDPLSTLPPTSSDSSFTTDLSLTFDSAFTTSGFTLTTSSSSPSSLSSIMVSSDPFSTTSSTDQPSSTSLSPTSATTSFPPPVTTAPFPMFSGGDPTQSRSSPNRTGMIVAVVTGAIVFTITVALLAIVYRKRYLRRVRRRATRDPFLDLDGEMVAVNQPLIIGDSPGGAVYSDPFTDDTRPTTQSISLSVTTGIDGMTGESNSSSRAVVGTDPTPSLDLGGGPAAEYHDRPQPTDQLSPSQPPLQRLPTEVARSRSPQSLPQVQTQFPPEFPVPRPSSPTLNVAYLRHTDPTTDRSPPGPGHYSPGNADGHMLTSAFSVASELSPQYSTHFPPLNIDETWRSSPDPIKASSSYRPPLDRGQSFTPSVNIPLHEIEDAVVITPIGPPSQSPAQSPTSPGSEYTSSPDTIRDGNFASRPSLITEVAQMLGHFQDRSNDSAAWTSTQSLDTSASSPVVMTAERVRVNPGPTPLSLTSATYMTSQGLSAGNRYGESLPPTGITNRFPQLPSIPGGPPPLPQLPQIQPLSLGKKRAVQKPT